MYDHIWIMLFSTIIYIVNNHFLVFSRSMFAHIIKIESFGLL